MSIYLTVENLPEGTKLYPLDRRLTLGRGKDNDLRIQDPGVSRHHAVVSLVAEQIVLEDLNSTNGTFVNGERVSRAALVSGDRIRLGRATLRVVAADAVPVGTSEVETIVSAMAVDPGQEHRYDELRRLDRKNRERIRAMEDQLDGGARIQREFLPKRLPTIAGWDLAACFEPAHQVAGDFYDAFLLPDGRLGIVIADVCGKGVGAGLFMSLTRGLLRAFCNHADAAAGFERRSEDSSTGAARTGSAKEVAGPNARVFRAVSMTSDYIAREHGATCIFVTLFLGVLDPVTGTMAYVNAGHEPVVVARSAGASVLLESLGPPAGLFPGIEIPVAQVSLAPGDVVFGYTDGVTDARSPAGVYFSRRRLLCLVERPAASARELIERVKKELSRHLGDACPADDVTMIALRRGQAAGAP